MAKQVVNIGDSGTAAKNKINGNFDELYEKAEQLGNQADIKAKVSASDDQAGYLAEKIVTPAKTLSIGTAGGNGAAQTLSVDVHVSILTRLVKMWDRTLNYRGMTWPGKATPQAPSNKDCYLVAESGVCFGVAGCTSGDFLYYSSSPAGWNRVTPNSDIYAATTKVLAMWNEGFVYKGKALYTTNPGVPTAKVFYFNTIESVARVYTQFGNEGVAANEFCIFKYDIAEDEWIKESIFSLPSGSTNLNEYMKKASNLSDLTNVVSARANLGVYSKAEIDFKTQQLLLQEQQDFGDLNVEIQDLQYSFATAIANESQTRSNADSDLSARIGVLENAAGATTQIAITEFTIIENNVHEIGESLAKINVHFTLNIDFADVTSIVIREIRDSIVIQEIDLYDYVHSLENQNNGGLEIIFDEPLTANTQFLIIAQNTTSSASKSSVVYFIYAWFLGTEALEDNLVTGGDVSELEKRLNSKTHNNITMNGEGKCLCFCCVNECFFRIWLGGLEVTSFTEATFDYELPDQSTVTYKLYKSDFAYNDDSIDVKLIKYQ